MDSPYINRFIQPDTLIPSLGYPQSLNRYTYVVNRPTVFNDPTGHVCSDPEDETPSCEGAAHVKTLVGNRMISGGKTSPKNKIHWDPETKPEGLRQEERKAAEEAYLHALEDPQYFYDLYFSSDLSVWDSAEVRYLDIYLQYSTLHTSADKYILGLYGHDVTTASVGRAINSTDSEAANDYASGLGLAGLVITFGHGARHLAGTSLNETAVESMIEQQIQNMAATQNIKGTFWGTVKIDGYTIDYRAWPLNSEHINVGTYTLRNK